MSKKILLIAFTVSLGGFLFGFDAGIISGVMSYAGPEFNLTDFQTGWVVSSPSFSAMIAMLFAGRLSDIIGRKKVLIGVAFLYTIAALFSGVSDVPQVQGALRGMGAVASGLITATGLKLIGALKSNVMGPLACISLAALTFVAVAWLRVPLTWVLLLCGTTACTWAYQKLRAA